MFTIEEYGKELDVLVEKDSKARAKDFWMQLISEPKYNKFLYYYVLENEKGHFIDNDGFKHVLWSLNALVKGKKEEDTFMEFLEVIKKIFPDTGLENEDEIMEKCLSDNDFLRHVAINAIKSRNFYNVFQKVMKMLMQQKETTISSLPEEACIVGLSFFTGISEIPQSQKKVPIRGELRQVFSVWALKTFFEIIPTKSGSRSIHSKRKPCGCDLVAKSEGSTYDALRKLWTNYRRNNSYKFYTLSEIEDLPLIINDGKGKIVFEKK